MTAFDGDVLVIGDGIAGLAAAESLACLVGGLQRRMHDETLARCRFAQANVGADEFVSGRPIADGHQRCR